MPTEVIMPKVDMDMTHGTLSVWHVAEGARVAKGDALFDIETDKAAMEVEAPAAGHLHHVSAKPGDRVAVGAPLAWIYAEGEAVGAAPQTGPVPEAADAMRRAAPGNSARPDPVSPGSGEMPAAVCTTPLPDAPPLPPRATPAARKVARDAGIALADIPGTGPMARIQRQDVTDYLRHAAPRPGGPQSGAPPAQWQPQPGPLHVSHRAGTDAAIPILLLHGFTADSQSWAPLEKALGAVRPVIRIDLPCHGRSPRRAVPGFAALARMMAEAFDAATRAHDRVHIVGHSLGGALAIALADIRGRQTASLSLIAPAGLGPEIDAATLAGIVRASRPESLAPWLRRLTASPETITDEYARAAMLARRDPALRAAQAEMQTALFPDGVQAFDLRAALSRLKCPAHILWGRSDRILPHAQALAADGDFAIHLLTGAGHVPQIECPDRVARILARQFAGAEVPD